MAVPLFSGFYHLTDRFLLLQCYNGKIKYFKNVVGKIAFCALSEAKGATIKMKKAYLILTLGLLIILTFILLMSGVSLKNQKEAIWSPFELNVAISSGQIEKVNVQDEHGIYNIDGITKSGTKFTAVVSKEDEPELLTKLVSKDVDVTTHSAPQLPWWIKSSVLFSMLFLFVIILLLDSLR